MGFPAYYGSTLVEYGTIVKKTAAYTAVPGDFVVMTGTAGVIVTLPPAATGGPVIVKQMVVGTTTGSITVIANTADGTATHIDNIAGTTGITITTQYTAVQFESDGVNWWRAPGNATA